MGVNSIAGSESQPHRPRVVVLGGGFGGVYAAMHLERLRRGHNDFDLALVNSENYFVFQPMLPEVISGSIGILDTVSPLRRLLPQTELFIREIDSIDLANKSVVLSQGFRPRPYVLGYDHLILALGTVTDFRTMPGLHEHALPFKNLADAVQLRNHLIHVFEEASIETDAELKNQLLTFVVAGGGFSGVEVAAELNDFVRRIAKEYQGIDRSRIRVVLLHSGSMILDRELTRELSVYANKILQDRGVEIRYNSRLRTATPDSAILESGERIPTKTLVSSVPSSPNPIIESLALPKDKGRIKTTEYLSVLESEDVWAIGDCALIQNPSGDGFAPPTAQHAIRQAEIAAHNIVSTLRKQRKKVYAFEGLGKMGSLGYRSAVAELFGGLRLSGLIAWILWRSIYWWKLPGLDRKLKVGLAWALDLLIAPELVQLKLGSSQGVTQSHFEPGEPVFRQGDLGDSLYIILKGEAEVIREENGSERSLARLQGGQFFGEMALMNQKTRNATVRCVTPMDVLVLRKGDFRALVSNLPDFRASFETAVKQRTGDGGTSEKDSARR
jgi:NADH dehydrogenase